MNLKASFLIVLVISSTVIFAQNVGINNTGAAPNNNAILDVDVSTNNKGILIPRVTTGQRTGIGGLAAADEGLTVYDETTNSYWLWDGTQWVQFLMEGNAWSLAGNAGTTPGTDFIGTTDAQDWVIKTNNTERVRVYSGGRTEFVGTTDASGAPNSGVIEVANALRIDGNEIITNTNSPIYINSDNNGDVIMDNSTFHMDASTNRVGIGIAAPAYTLETVAGGSVSVNDGYLRKVRAMYLQDWDDNTGGTDNKYRLLARDGAWQFYDGGVVVGNYGNGTWGDLANGHLIVESRIGVATTNPSTQLDINGTVRIRGGGPTVGDLLMCNNANGTATWAAAGYGMVPIGSIVAWHGNLPGVPGLPAGWVQCNGGVITDAASPMNGQAIPNLNGGGTASGGGAIRGRFLRGHTTSGLFEGDRTNNFYRYEQDDADGGPNRWEGNLSQTGGYAGYMGSYHSNDRRRFRLRGGETRPTNMSVRWIMRIK